MLMSAVARVKPYLRWLVLGAALFFLLATLRQHWQSLMTLQITPATWAGLVVALGVTLLAHIWSGWVWHWILQGLGIQVRGLWTTSVYLKTNVAKYLPGNVWHFYGRVRSLQAAGATTVVATTGVLLEPVLMAATALLLAVIGNALLPGWIFWGCLVMLIAILAAIHPRLFNPLMDIIGSVVPSPQTRHQPRLASLQHYPVKPLIGELGFMILRGLGFALVLGALQPLGWAQLMPVLGAFGVAWLLGLLLPGAPGGLGVFEAVAVALLQAQLPIGQVLSGVIGYRLVSTLAETIGAGLIWLDHPSRDLAIRAATPFLLPAARGPEAELTAPDVLPVPANPTFSQSQPSSLPASRTSPEAGPDSPPEVVSTRLSQAPSVEQPASVFQESVVPEQQPEEPSA